MTEEWEQPAHALRRKTPCMLLVKDFRHATAATHVLDHQVDIAKMQEWLGRANIATTRIHDHRKARPEDGPTFRVS